MLTTACLSPSRQIQQGRGRQMSYHEAELGRRAGAPERQARAGARPSEPWERESSAPPPAVRTGTVGGVLGKTLTVEPAPPPGGSPVHGLSAHMSLQLVPLPLCLPQPHSRAQIKVGPEERMFVVLRQSRVPSPRRRAHFTALGTDGQ